MRGRSLDIGQAYAPFFSPDSQWIGFFDRGEIKKVAIAGGPIITIGPFTGASLGASWGDDNAIVFATDDPGTGLWRVSANGGSPTMSTRPDEARHESDHAFPSVLPGSQHVLFTIAAAGRADSAQIAVLDPGRASGRHSCMAATRPSTSMTAARASLGI